MYFLLLLFSLLSPAFSFNYSTWREQDLRYHECRSCQEPAIDQSNCPESFYDCDGNEPMRAAVLSASDECRCQSITCANRGWRLAVNGSIVDKVRCEARNWVVGPELPAPSVICAKFNPLATTTTTQPPPVCKPKPADVVCDASIYEETQFTAACFDGLRAHCVGDNVLTSMEAVPTADPPLDGYMTLVGSAQCLHPSSRLYAASMFGISFNANVISCMPCPFMRGEATTTFTGAHEPAMYDSCVVKCGQGLDLYGKVAGEFKEAEKGTAYFAYPFPYVDASTYHFLDTKAQKFAPDFYCAEVAPPVCKPPTAEVKCSAKVYPDTPFTSACFDGRNVHCIGNNVLGSMEIVPNSVPDTYVYVTLEGSTSCPENSAIYAASTLGYSLDPYFLSCMPCKYMEGTASTSFGNDPKPAIYSNGLVKCADVALKLFGKTDGEFKEVERNIGYYAYPKSGSSSDFFIDSAGVSFEADFYCAVQ